MSLEEQIAADLVVALRGGDVDRKHTLRLLKAAIHNATIEAGRPLDDDEVRAVLQRQAKLRRESIEQFEQAGREDLAEGERVELAIIESYLPRRLSEAEIEVLAEEQIKALGATGPADKGRVMAALMAELAGRGDGKTANAIVTCLLAG